MNNQPSNNDLVQLIISTKEDIMVAITNLDQKVSGHDQKFDSIDQRFESIDQRFESLDQKFTKKIEYLAKVQIETKDELKADIKAVDDRLDYKTDDIIELLRGYITYSSQKYDNHERRIVALEG